MLKIEIPNRFKKDLYKAIRQNKDTTKLFNVVSLLSNCIMLSNVYQNHKLEGVYEDYWECHIEADWLLIYSYKDNKKILYLNRIGSHSELFG